MPSLLYERLAIAKTITVINLKYYKYSANSLLALLFLPNNGSNPSTE